MNERRSLDKSLGWLAFPGLIRAIAMLQGVFFVLLLLQPEAANVLAPDRDKILAGEWWRVIGFVFEPIVHPNPNPNSLLFSVLFMFIAIRISFLFNDALEAEWGTLKTSLYVYAVIIFQAVALFIFNHHIATGIYYQALFFAFATIMPRYTFYLFFILPIQVWVLAALTGVTTLFGIIRNPFSAIFYLTAFFPYLFWAAPYLIKLSKTRGQTAIRRNRFEKAKLGNSPTLHCCLVCQRTEASDPDLDFRVNENGDEYCLDHLEDADNASAS